MKLALTLSLFLVEANGMLSRVPALTQETALKESKKALVGESLSAVAALGTQQGFLALTQETALKESKEVLVVDSIKENTVPYDIPDRSTLNAAGLPATFRHWDMISFAALEDAALGEYPDAANYIFIPMEV
jgi:hypothetical protein